MDDSFTHERTGQVYRVILDNNQILEGPVGAEVVTRALPNSESARKVFEDMKCAM